MDRNSPKRLTITVRGRAEAVETDAQRQRVFELAPEVEQRHDTEMRGAALLVHVERLQAFTPTGPVLVVPGR